MNFVLLKDIVDFIRTGKTPPSHEEKYFNGDLKWFTPGDLDKSKRLKTSQRSLTNIALQDKKAILYPKDTLLVSCIGDIGKLGITTENCSSNQQITGIKPKGNIDVEYLYYWFRANKKVIQHYSNSAIVPILNNKTLETIKVLLFPLTIQQKIASILHAADELRQKDKALVAKYNELTQALFLDMFGDPVSNPKGWDKNPTIDYSSCIVPGRDKPKSFTGSIPWVTTEDLKHLSYTFKSKKNIGLSEDEIKDAKSKVIPEQSVIITCVGDLGIVTINQQKIVINQQLHAFQCKKELNPLFLMYSLSFQKSYMYKMSSSTTVPYMNKTVCNSIPTLVPPIELQNQFAERVELIEKQKQLAEESLKNSEALFNSLLDKAFKGELTSP